MGIIQDKVLHKACEICVADAGKEDDKLVNKLYKYMYENYISKDIPWTYTMIDDLLYKWDKEGHVSYKENIFDNNISIIAFIGQSGHERIIGGADCGWCGEQSGEWYFNRLFVNEEYRGEHIGSCILDKMLYYIKEKDIVLHLDINPYGTMSFEQLEAFYMRHGFEKVYDDNISEGYFSYYYNLKKKGD